MLKIKKIFVLTLSLLISIQSSANLMCTGLFTDTARVLVQNMSEKNMNHPTELHFNEKSLSNDPNKALLEFLTLASYTRGTEFLKTKSGKTRISKFDLGLDIGDGYSVEIRYRADERQDLRFTAESATLVSPTNRTEKIAPHLIDFNQLKFKDKYYNLADIYPDGRSIDLNIPIEIKGNSIPVIEKMISHLPFFKKNEIRNLVLSESILKIKILGHLRFTAHYLKEFAIKAPFKLIANTALAVTLIAVTGYNLKDWAVQSTTKSTTKGLTETQNSQVSDWYQNSLRKISQSSSPEIKNEISQILKLATPRSTSTLGNLKDTSLSRDFMWIVESQIPHSQKLKTMLFVSSDSDHSSEMRYMGIEINSAEYPELIKQILKEGRYLRAK